MEIRTIYCDLCKEKIDEMNIYDLRQFTKLIHYRFEKDNMYLASGCVCKKCSKIVDKKIKQLFKELGFKHK